MPLYSCPDVNDQAAILARGFDPLLANLLYSYGNALLCTYQLNTGMFGDKAGEKVEEQADAIEGDAQVDKEALMASLMDGAAANLMIEAMQAMQAEEWGEEEEGGEGEEEDGEDGGEGEEGEEGEEDVEDIDADAEADRQENGDDEKEKEEEVDAEEEEEVKKNDSTANDNANDNTANENDNQDGEAKEAELNDLELAWQVLEIARVVYSTQPQLKLELSYVHFTLGSIAFEDDKMAEATVEFEKALKYAEEANNRRAQAQVLLLMSNISEATSAEAAVADLERARSLMSDEIDSIKSDPNVDIKALQDSLVEIDARIFSLNEKFVPANPDDVKDLPDPSKGKVTFSFSAPTIDSGSGAAESSDAPVNVLQPKKKTKEGIRPISLPSVSAPSAASATSVAEAILAPVDEVSETRGQKRTALDVEATEEIYTEEPVAKRAKVAEE